MTWDPATGSLDIETLRRAYAQGLTPLEVVTAVYDRIAARGEDPCWIRVLPRGEAEARARALMADPGARDLPLYGVPFGMKDNFDLEGYPTTHAVRALDGTPATTTSPLIQRLLDAGAIPIGKQNQDQFGMGLIGLRTDYGVPACVFDPQYLSGGSSSGGGVLTAAGIVSFSAANDAAGSGRVPAALNNIVGYKPTPGLVPRAGPSAAGMVGADNFLSLTVQDAVTLSNLWIYYDSEDPFSRPEAADLTLVLRPAPSRFRFAIPDAATIVFDGDAEAERLFRENVARLETMGGTAVEIDFTDYLTAARLLYEGPYISQRYANFGPFFEENPDALHPATAEILGWGRTYDAADVFRVQYQMAGYKQKVRALFRDVDVIVTPTCPSTYPLADVAADNIRLNAMMGTYTNFVNLLELPAISVPAGFRADGKALGTMITGPCLGDNLICNIGAALHAASGLAIGTTALLPG